MSVPVLQAAVNAGEISPSLYGRVDLAKYRAGCSTLRNMWVSYRGGASSRGGTKFCGQSKQAGTDYPPHLIPFQFSVTQGYALEFGNFYMRVYANGAAVTETGYAITDVTQNNPGFVTATGNDFVQGDWVYVSGIDGMDQMNGNTYVVASAGNSFSLRSTLTNALIDTGTFVPYVSGGTVARIFTLTTPYAAAHVRSIKWAQSADVMSLTHPSYPPYDLARIDVDDWTITETTFSTSITAPATSSAAATTTTSSLATHYSYAVTAIDALTGQESVASPQANVTNSVNIAQTLGSVNISWAAVTGASRYNVYKAPPAFNSTVPVGSLYGYLGMSFGLAFSDTNITQDLSVTPPLHLNPFAPGAIDYFTITATGSGYTSSIPPSVVISDPTGYGALADAVVVGAGVQAIIVRNGGVNYTNPTVSIQYGGSGSGATFAAIPNGSGLWDGGSNVSVSTTGSGYATPAVIATYILGGNTVSLAATSVSVSSGHITAVTFPNTLAGQKPASTSVSILAQDSIGTGATATAHVGPTTGTYPSCVTYFQQRRFYAASNNNPDTYWASQPGAFTNMDSSIPVIPSDALVGTPWAQQVNGIQAMVSMPGGLVVLTGLGAWQVSGGGQLVPITPADQVATPQAYNGCAPDIQPININFEILYVQSKGSNVRDLSYNLVLNIYTGTDITILSNHLFDGKTIVDWDWAAEPNKLLWVVRNDGSLLSLTFIKEQDVYAWARHDTNGLFAAVCCVSEPPVDAAYFVVTRRIDDGTARWVNYIERMDDRFWPTIEDAWCVDCGLSLTQPMPADTLTPSAIDGTAQIGSLNLINGGADYVAPVATVIDDGGSGSGATVTLTVVGGVITAADVVTPGSGYVHPIVQIYDTAGDGGVVQAIVENHITLRTGIPIFSAANVGDIVRGNGGKAEIVEFLTTRTVTANVIEPFAPIPNDPDETPMPIRSQEWTMTTPVTTVRGLDHLEGMSVVALADGSVVNGLTVSGGAVTLPAPASSIVIGLGFTAQLQTLYLETPTTAGSTSQTRRKNADQLGLRVEASRAPEVGANQPDQATQPNGVNPTWTNMAQIKPRGPEAYPGQPEQLFTGDYFTGLLSGWNENAQIAVQQRDPVPLTVLSLVPWVETGDTPG